ncbi:MAG: tyrosine-type recombinase/integrase [bacterium]|nr:tyrosine-type recombinase/integrase [bacterium]
MKPSPFQQSLQKNRKTASTKTQSAKLRRAKLAQELATVAAYVEGGLSANTIRAYASDMAHYKHWGGTIPATPQTVARYLAECAKTLKVSSLSRHLAALAREHAARGLPSPTQSQLVKATLRGIRRAHGCAQKQAKPLTPALMRKLIKPVTEYSALRNCRDRALLLVGFYGGFRRSELASLTIKDVIFVPRGAIIHLRSAKTDQNSVGREIALPNTQTTVCAIRALRDWIACLSDYNNQSDNFDGSSALFRKIDRYDNIGGGLCGAGITWILQARMQAKGMEVDGYSAHSLRAGLVTSAAKAGAPIWQIQRQTGHKSEQMVGRYIRNVGLFDSNVVSRIF